jgi:hypothetical protein
MRVRLETTYANQGLALPTVAAYRAAGLLNLDKTLAHVSLKQQHQFSARRPSPRAGPAEAAGILVSHGLRSNSGSLAMLAAISETHTPRAAVPPSPDHPTPP